MPDYLCTDLAPEHRYGPKDWNLQVSGKGIVKYLEGEGVEYLWLVELGNPQKTDHDMKILREHIDSQDSRWPINRGLKILHDLVIEQGRQCCLLCACKDYDACHRKSCGRGVEGSVFQWRAGDNGFMSLWR